MAGGCGCLVDDRGRGVVAPEGLARHRVPFGAVVDDYKRRMRRYGSDWRDGVAFKAVSAALYMFFATFASTVALAEVARKQTGGRLGTCREYACAEKRRG